MQQSTASRPIYTRLSADRASSSSLRRESIQVQPIRLKPIHPSITFQIPFDAKGKEQNVGRSESERDSQQSKRPSYAPPGRRAQRSMPSHAAPAYMSGPSPTPTPRAMPRPAVDRSSYTRPCSLSGVQGDRIPGMVKGMGSWLMAFTGKVLRVGRLERYRVCGSYGTVLYRTGRASSTVALPRKGKHRKRA